MSFEEVKELRIIALVQGLFGERKVKNIKGRAPTDWKVESIKLPKFLPLIIDEPDEFLPGNLPESDLVLSLGEIPQVGQLVSAVVKRTGAKALICPIDNNAWMPPGLKNQIAKEMKALNVAAAFPKPFCSLVEVGDRYIDTFAKYFGRPILRIKCGKVLDEIEVIRGAPCGSTHFMAKEAIGTKVEDAREKCGLIAHHYPCLASMDTDPEIGDTIMHKSGYIVMNEVERAVIECLGRKPWAGSYLDPK